MAAPGLPPGMKAGAHGHREEDDDALSGRRGQRDHDSLEAGCHTPVSQERLPQHRSERHLEFGL